jgi:hypothetical protein
MSEIPAGPTRLDVLGPESVADHEAVYQFIEVLSGPSIEATNAIVAHGRLLNRLSIALEHIAAQDAALAQVEAERDWLAQALVENHGCPQEAELCSRFAQEDGERCWECARAWAAKEASCPTP